MIPFFPSIFFSVDVKHSFDLSEALRGNGIKAYPLSGDTPTAERRRFVSMFREGALDGLVSCGVLQEGFDAPIAMGAFLARPTKSGLLYRQQVGRVLRPFPAPSGDRPYQSECLSSIEDHLKGGTTLQLAVLPTGTGKTYIAAHTPEILRRWKQGKPRGRLLFVTHRDEIVEQTADTFRLWQPGLTVGIERAGECAGNADVVVASVSSVGPGSCDDSGIWTYGKRLLQWNPDHFDGVVLDESHHAVRGRYYHNVLRHMRCLKGQNDLDAGKLLLCITATPSRADNAGMEAICDKIVYSYELRAAIKQGYLAPIRAFRIETEVDLSKVHTAHGDFNVSELENAVNNPVRNELVAKEYLRIRSTLTSCGPGPGFHKPFAIIADFVDNTGKHQICLTPSLFGLRDTFNPKGKDLLAQVEEVEAMEAANPGLDLRAETDIDALRSKIERLKTSATALDLLRPPQMPAELRALSKFAWLKEGEGAYHLGLMSGAMVSIRENTLGQYDIYRHMKGIRTKLAAAKTLAEAVDMADREVPTEDRKVMAADAGWRKEPPTLKQIGLLRTLDRRYIGEFRTAEALLAHALARFHAGDTSYSRGEVSRRIDSLRAAR